MTKNNKIGNSLLSSNFIISEGKTYTDFIVEKFIEVNCFGDLDNDIIAPIIKRILPRIFTIIEDNDSEIASNRFDLLRLDGTYEYSITGLITRLLFDEDLLSKIFKPEQVERLLCNKNEYINGKFEPYDFLYFEYGKASDDGEEFDYGGAPPHRYEIYEKIIHTTLCLAIFKLLKNGLLNEDCDDYSVWEDNHIRFVKELFIDEDSFIHYFNFKAYYNCGFENKNFSTEQTLQLTKTDSIRLNNISTEHFNDPEILLAIVKNNANALQYASKELCGDRKFMLAAVKKNVNALQYASKELCSNQKFMLAAVNKHVTALQYAPIELLNDREIVLTAVNKDGQALQYASDELRNDKEIVLAAIQQDGFAFKYASEGLRNDRKFVMTAVKKNGNILKYASEVLRNNRKIVLAAVKKNGSALDYASKELRNDWEIVLAGIKKNYNVFKYASEELHNNWDFVLAAINKDINVLNCMRSNREFLLAAINNKIDYAIAFLSDELYNDRELMLAAVKHDRGRIAFRFVPKEFYCDKEFILAAVKENSSALFDASNELRNDREIVLAAINHDGKAVVNASNELLNDREIMLAAVNKDGTALEYASKELRNDREIVLAAVNKDGTALEYASKELRNDREIVLAAVNKDILALRYASDELRNDRNLFFQIFKSYKICIHAGKFVLAADGPLLILDFEESDYKEENKVVLNIRVEDENCIAITPIITEMVLCKFCERGYESINHLQAGYLIYENEVFFRSEDNCDETSPENIGLNRIVTKNNTPCSLEDFKKFLQPYLCFIDEDKVVMLHKFVPQIMEFQKHYEVSEINKDKMSWDGHTLTIFT